jgi:hypothetical protein
MAMTAIPRSLELSMNESIGGSRGTCQSPGGIMRRNSVYDNVVLCHNQAMKPSRNRSSRVFTISFPEDLAKQVVAVADEESRNISELFREAFRAYRMERNERKLVAARADAATRVSHHYTEDDVEALIDEIRNESYRSRKLSA